MKKVLITGGNKGIGLEVTKLFIKNNYEVIIIARDYNDFELNDNKNVKKIQYDLTDISGIEKLVHEIGHPDIWYGITKAGIINATKSFAKILGPKGIIINSVAPGPVETEMMKVIPEDRKKAIKSNVFLDRFAKPVEVAKTIYWLATESPEYINGTCIDINNGAFPR